jgi:hypothetical protein
MLDLCLNAPAFHGPLIVLGTISHVKSITYEKEFCIIYVLEIEILVEAS